MTRRWFQIHLSTALLLALLSAGMVGLNLSVLDTWSVAKGYPDLPLVEEQGWPFAVYRVTSERVTPGLSLQKKTENFSVLSLLINCVLIAAILFVISRGIEWIHTNVKPNMTRRWCQIHLSTALLLMFLAAGLMWANLHVQVEFPFHKFVGTNGIRTAVDENVRFAMHYYGWPCLIKGCMVANHVPGDNMTLNGIVSFPEDIALVPEGYPIYWNSAFAVVALVLSTVLCEFFIRRREARKP